MPRILYTNPVDGGGGGGSGGVGTGSTGLSTSQTYVGADGLVGYGLNNGTYAWTADSAALDIVGDLEITARLQPTSWSTTAANQGIVSKRSTAANYSYWLVLYGGKLTLQWSTDGTAVTTAAGLTAVPFTTEAGWVRATLDVDNGAGGYTVTFYTAADSATEPTSWTPLGAAVTVNAGVTSIFAGTSVVEFGSNLLGGAQMIGCLKRGIIRNGIGGTVVCDADFVAATDDCLAFTEGSSNAAPVVITTNRYTLGVPNTQFQTVGTQSMSGNQTHYMPFEVSASITVDMFAVESVTAGTTGTLRVGVFAADSNLQPTGTCVAQGAIPYTTTAGVYTKQITPVVLAPGMYLMAFNSTSSVTWRRLAGGITPIPVAIGASPFASRIYATGVTMTGDYTTGPTWPLVPAVFGTSPMIHCAFLRWKAV